MARSGRRKTEEEMAAILRVQVERGQTNQECAAEAGLSVETIKRWRARLRVRSAKATELVEWVPSPAKTVASLVVELPDGVRLTWASGWEPSQVAVLVRFLRPS